ncbi:MAG: IS110 family transposase [Chloroflexi bacterium]|nr:IS110 family transposase [Chloroflexota bacterium]
MKRKGRRTKGVEEARPFEGMSRVNENAAGVDVGATEIVASVSGSDGMQIVKAFGNYTMDLQAIGKWFGEHGIKMVAMESTGVYWIPLFEELEREGFECLLISSRSIRRVPGRKSDIEDAQWIQTLHSYGLLESSFRPQADLIALRTMLRHRAQMMEHRAPHILHMQKALLQMNIQLSQALSDVTGVSGLAIIRAIVEGVRNAQVLAAFRDPGCKKSEEEIEKALTGTWREEHLFVLKQSLALYDFYTEQIEACDEEVDRLYALTRPDWERGELPVVPEKKKNAHSKNKPKNSLEIRQHLHRINGVDLTVVDGFGASLAQTVTMEVGSNVGEKFPTEKHFCSWLGLAPKHDISGGKVLKNRTIKTKNRAGQAFRMAAQSVKRADNPFGALYRRLRARLGPAQATVATAHAIARVVYKMLKYKVEYDPLSVNEYQKQYEAQQVKYMKKKAAKLGYELVPA